jgi:S-adenosyl-L-methionine hydrolase (adenosine-forming)
MHVITLLTDFGLRDAYVGAMKGVILGVAPDARIVDISHEVAPQDVVEGAWLLAAAFRYFPPGAVHVAVVDPEVGSNRRAVAAEAGGWRFVGPDNGVLSWALEDAGDVTAVELTNDRYFRPEVSRTFHGRDVFAPVAAHLASGVPLEDLGPRVHDLARLPVPEPVVERDRITCEIVHVDRFGNCVTGLTGAKLDAWAAGRPLDVSVAGRSLGPPRATYAEVDPGEPLALVESTGRLEVAVRNGDAAADLALARGWQITITAR